MTTDQNAAEESLRALARDLVEELAAGRAVILANDFSIEPLDPDSGDPLELVSFQVRPFQREQRTRAGRVIPEAVRGHSASRTGPGVGDTIASGEHFVAGAPGHVTGDISEAKWVANQWKKRTQAVGRLHQDIGKTLDRVSPGWGSTGDKDLAAATWRVHGKEAAGHLAQAQQALQHSADQPSLSEAYHHLAQAHQHGVEHVLSRAGTPEAQQAVRGHLDRIQAHMEALDKIAGTRPDMTRKIVGTAAQQNERVARVRGDAASAVQDAAEKGDTEGVKQAAVQHQGLVEPDLVKAAHERAGQVNADATARYVQEHHGIQVGDRVRVGGRQEGMLSGLTSANVGQVSLDNGQTVQAALGDLKAVQPEYPRGASAIYPQVGAHARNTMPGGTLSGHENAGRIIPMQAPAVAQHPAEAELAKLKDQAARFAQREAERRQADLREHVAGMKAAEAAYRGVAPEGGYRPLTDSEFAAHKDFVGSQVEAALRAGLATDQQHSLDGKGQVWAPQRALLHGEIVKDYMDRHVDVPSERQALFMGGLSGAGKSTALKGHPEINLKDYAVLNPDEFKEDLMRRGAVPEVPGLSPMESAALVHEESAYLTDLVAHELERRGKNVAWDVTMKNHDVTADRIRLLKSKGYRVHSVFVDVPVEKSAARVESRYRQGLEGYRKGENPMGGRFIPRSVVLAGEDKPGTSRARATFDKLRPEFASWELRDGTGYPSRVVAKSGSTGGGIPSVEALRRAAGAVGTGSTEQSARQAETGQTAADVAGLTQSNPSAIIDPEESESR